jgi:hypothetical protein
MCIAFTRTCFNIPRQNYSIAEYLIVVAVRNALKYVKLFGAASCEAARHLHDNQLHIPLNIIWKPCLDAWDVGDRPLS